MTRAAASQLCLPLPVAVEVAPVVPARPVRSVRGQVSHALLVRLSVPLSVASLRALVGPSQLLLVFPLAPVMPPPAPVLRPRNQGGPDLSSPCVGCLQRACCVAPCSLLDVLVGPEEIRAWDEVSSPALMEGRGYDPQFMVMPEALREEEPEAAVALLARRHGPKLREALGDLTPVQREVIEHLLAGRSRTEVRRLRHVSRQAIHKDYHAAVKALRRALGAAEPRRPS